MLYNVYGSNLWEWHLYLVFRITVTAARWLCMSFPPLREEALEMACRDILRLKSETIFLFLFFADGLGFELRGVNPYLAPLFTQSLIHFFHELVLTSSRSQWFCSLVVVNRVFLLCYNNTLCTSTQLQNHCDHARANHQNKKTGCGEKWIKSRATA